MSLQTVAEHQERIKAVMSACDYYHTECHRDVKLAREFGFKGEVMPVLPTVGFDLAQSRQLRQPGPTSVRRLIALKGKQGRVYRGLVGLRAVELCADLLKEEGYRLAIYLADPETKIAAELLAQSTGLPIDIIPYSTHEDMLRLHGRARVSTGLSISDGLPASALEAMVMGSFPIQSNTSCLEELIQDGQSGIFVHPEDPEAVAAALRRAVTDDELVDHAAEINARIAAEHLDQLVVRPQVVQMYERIAAQARMYYRVTKNGSAASQKHLDLRVSQCKESFAVSRTTRCVEGVYLAEVLSSTTTIQASANDSPTHLCALLLLPPLRRSADATRQPPRL